MTSKHHRKLSQDSEVEEKDICQTDSEEKKKGTRRQMGNFPFAVPLSFTRHGFVMSEQEGQFQMAHPKSVRKRTWIAVNPNKDQNEKNHQKVLYSHSG